MIVYKYYNNKKIIIYNYILFYFVFKNRIIYNYIKNGNEKNTNYEKN